MAPGLWRALARGGDVRGSQAGAHGTHGALLELARNGPTPLAGVTTGGDGPLSIAAIVPSFRRGSGGHATIVRILAELRRRGHEISVWLEDSEGRHVRESPAVTRRSFEQFFAGEDIPLSTELSDFPGADVVLATGWQTVARAMLLEGVGARAYLVQDHEPDFYGSSSEALWAEQTYRQGLYCICASPWLAGLLRERYDAAASHFDLGVDHDVYRPLAGKRPPEGERVVFYARAVTPRRAVPLGLLALEELAQRRPGVEIQLYGESNPLDVPFPHRNLGVLAAGRLAELYSQASVGMVLSLTNPSLIALDMMASGLACVELASPSMLATFGADGPLALSPPEPLALCATIERLLDDEGLRERAARQGRELIATRTWAAAAEQVESGLRAAITLPRPGAQADRAAR